MKLGITEESNSEQMTNRGSRFTYKYEKRELKG
jgi:hypothetical protein